ncbi:MAG: glycosyltransferase family 4 protein [Candidatus Abyssobacteria bacterium SURF_5]|uniref:Glycosyltransferase family 4 protein n=1 Tax=Abyssobacteria bacterium (strain SURF_5) TaxID=2093360 RepID=A0A3A4NB57_ABYX5|nr:MAG: glycosyltransferase family 4 protein [Candidatus Abyssubacteria bacterium SURF_5]
MEESRRQSRSVCLITNTYPDFPESSRAVFMRDLARLLSQRNWTVAVVAPKVYAESRRHEREEAVEVFRFSSFLGGKLLVEYDRMPVFRLTGYMVSGIIKAARQSQKCDLIHAHWVMPAGLIALIAGRLTRKPVVVTAHGSDILVMPKRSFLLRRIARHVLERADAVTSVAEHVTAEIRNLDVRRDDILAFPMSVPTESFTPNGEGAEACATETLIFSNRSLYPIYDLELLVRATPLILQRVPEASICIAGKGPQREALSQLAEKLGVSGKLTFLGEIPHEQMPKYLRKTAAYVSTALSDGASVSLLEAMACGAVPVVADIPANREWIHDGRNGFLFAPGNAEALADKLELCLTQPDLRKTAREINTRIVQQRAQWNLNVDKLLNLYERILARQ